MLFGIALAPLDDADMREGVAPLGSGPIDWWPLFVRENVWTPLGFDVGPQWVMVGAIAGLVLGGSQALARSLFAQITPETRSGEFFSFFGFMSRASSVFGPMLYVAATAFFDTRVAILSIPNPNRIRHNRAALGGRGRRRARSVGGRRPPAGDGVAGARWVVGYGLACMNTPPPISTSMVNLVPVEKQHTDKGGAAGDVRFYVYELTVPEYGGVVDRGTLPPRRWLEAPVPCWHKASLTQRPSPPTRSGNRHNPYPPPPLFLETVHLDPVREGSPPLHAWRVYRTFNHLIKLRELPPKLRRTRYPMRSHDTSAA